MTTFCKNDKTEKLTSKKRTTGVGEDVEKGEPSYTVGGNANSSSMELNIELKKLKMSYPVTLLNIYPKEMKPLSQRNIYFHIHCSIIHNYQSMETT